MRMKEYRVIMEKIQRELVELSLCGMEGNMYMREVLLMKNILLISKMV